MNEAKHLLRSKEGKRKVKIEVRVMHYSVPTSGHSGLFLTPLNPQIRRQRMKILAQRRKVEAAVAEATQVLRDVNSNAAEVCVARLYLYAGACAGDKACCVRVCVGCA